MPALPSDIPPADDMNTVPSYGGVASVEAATPAAAYQTGASAETTPKHGRRAGVLAAGLSLAAVALVVAGVVTGSQTDAAASMMGTGDALVEESASAAKIAKVAADGAGWVAGEGVPPPADSSETETTEDSSQTDYTGFHVMFLLVDDMGWNDMGYQSTDTEYTTETLNHMAEKGVKLTNYYTQSSCTPARVAVLTGRYPHKVGMGYDGEGTFVVDSPYGVPLKYDLIGRHFSKAGYRTAFIGKWNVGHVEENYLPHRRGFDSSIMYNSDAIHYYNFTASPALNVDTDDGEEVYDPIDMLTASANHPFELAKDEIGTYTATLFTERAMAEFAKTQEDERSLYLHLAFQSVHVPHNTPPLELYSDEEDGWKLKEVSTDVRYHFGRTAIAMDRSIKKLMNHIENLGLSDNLLVAVASDNGACPTDGGNNYPYRGGKFQSWEGGVHVPAFVYSAAMESSMVGRHVDTLFHAIDWLPTLAMATGAVSDVSTELPGIDGKNMANEILHGKTTSNERKELLLHMNKWTENDESTLETMMFENSYMSLISIQDGHQWKILFNQYKADRVEPTHTTFNLSCFESIGDPSNHLFDLTNDPLEEHDLKDARPDVFKNLTLAVREHYDESSTPVWAPIEGDLAFDAWAPSAGGNGFVTPWHKPQASVYQGRTDAPEQEDSLIKGMNGQAAHPMV